MRTSNDIYKLLDGTFVSIDQMTEPPQGAVIWKGYDYTNQYWVHNGQKDTRTLEQLSDAILKGFKAIKP